MRTGMHISKIVLQMVLGYYMEFDQAPSSCRRLLARGRSDFPLQLYLYARIIAHLTEILFPC